MAATVSFKPSFFKDLGKLPRDVREKTEVMIEQVRPDPFSVAAKKLAGQKRLYRCRIGDYRLVYYLDQEEGSVLFLFVKHRKEIYRSL